MTRTAVSFGGTALGANELALIRKCVSTFPRLSRTELAATVCEWLGWQRPNGHLKTRECRDLLEQLDERGWLELPTLRATGRPRGATTVVPQTSQGASQTPVTGPLRALQPIRLQRVQQPAEQAFWRVLIGRYHYLGHRTAYGASLRDLITAGDERENTLGCLQFSSPAWHMHARDTWIGWDESAGQHHLPRPTPWQAARQVIQRCHRQPFTLSVRFGRDLLGAMAAR